MLAGSATQSILALAGVCALAALAGKYQASRRRRQPAGILLTLLISATSYRWLEKPSRSRTTRFLLVLVPSLIAALAVVVTSIAILGQDGIPGRFQPRVLSIAKARDAFAPLAHACTDVSFDYALAHCHLGPKGTPQFILWGDSRAAANSEGVAVALDEPGVVLSTGGCAPSSGWIGPNFRGS